jgi:hypothetical protein
VYKAPDLRYNAVRHNYLPFTADANRRLFVEGVCAMRYEIKIDMRVLTFREQLSLLAAGVGLLFDRLQGKKAAVILPPDDLTRIKGIGPTFARRLQEAGITSFAALAALSPEEAREISGATNWQADPADWIAEAKALANR